MLLSKLVFLAVKNVVYLNDTSFNYDGFCAGDFDNDIDYITNINNVFSPLNEAISRLQDLDRVPYAIEELHLESGKVANKPENCKEIIGVAQVSDFGGLKKLAFAPFGLKQIRIISPFSTIRNKIFVEFKRNIPVFSKSDIGVEDKDIELFEEYGIDDGMANYIMEYVQGKLLEPLAPELANMHITRAEAYFNNVPTAEKNFPQLVVEHKFSIGG